MAGKAAQTGKQSTCAPCWFTGVMGMARWKGNTGNRGRPVLVEGRAFSIEYVDGPVAMSLETPDKIRNLQRKLYCKAKAEPAFRFYLLYDKICREDILVHAYRLARVNAGAPGVDGMTFARIEEQGLEAWLAGLRAELISKMYRPDPVRRVMIPKANGGERPLGIPTIRDRVIQTAAKIVIEPNFEADFEDNAYG